MIIDRDFLDSNVEEGEKLLELFFIKDEILVSKWQLVTIDDLWRIFKT